MKRVDSDGAPHSIAGKAALVFFLHVPRTAGRTYHSCFMKLGSPPSARCEKSYDVLRLNASVTGCSLLGSHDDFSIRQHLPAKTAIVTQLRCILSLRAWQQVNTMQTALHPARAVRQHACMGQ